VAHHTTARKNDAGGFSRVAFPARRSSDRPPGARARTPEAPAGGCVARCGLDWARSMSSSVSAPTVVFDDLYLTPARNRGRALSDDLRTSAVAAKGWSGVTRARAPSVANAIVRFRLGQKREAIARSGSRTSGGAWWPRPAGHTTPASAFTTTGRAGLRPARLRLERYPIPISCRVRAGHRPPYSRRPFRPS
jgi:hypothetical protein